MMDEIDLLIEVNGTIYAGHAFHKYSCAAVMLGGLNLRGKDGVMLNIFSTDDQRVCESHF